MTRALPLPRPLLALAARIVGSWLAIHFYLLTVRAALLAVNARPMRVAEDVAAYTILALIWAMLTPPVTAIAERLRMEEHRLRDALCLVALVPVLSLAASVFTYAVFRYPIGSMSPLRAILLRSAHADLMVAALAVAFAFVIAGNYEATWRERMRAELDTLLTRSTAAQLRARLTPRFLFTTLDSIATITPRDPVRADRLLGDLARLLQTFMQFDRAESVTLEEELELADRYARVHPSRIPLRLVASDEALRTRIPPLVLLPLIEALTSQSVAPVEIRASVPDGLTATLRTRTEMTAEELRTALDDLHARLERDGGTLTISRSGADVVASLRLPQIARVAA